VAPDLANQVGLSIGAAFMLTLPVHVVGEALQIGPLVLQPFLLCWPVPEPCGQEVGYLKQPTRPVEDGGLDQCSATNEADRAQEERQKHEVLDLEVVALLVELEPGVDAVLCATVCGGVEDLTLAHRSAEVPNLGPPGPPGRRQHAPRVPAQVPGESQAHGQQNVGVGHRKCPGQCDGE